jgi:hypothetical protein
MTSWSCSNYQVAIMHVGGFIPGFRFRGFRERKVSRRPKQYCWFDRFDTTLVNKNHMYTLLFYCCRGGTMFLHEQSTLMCFPKNENSVERALSTVVKHTILLVTGRLEYSSSLPGSISRTRLDQNQNRKLFAS